MEGLVSVKGIHLNIFYKKPMAQMAKKIKASTCEKPPLQAPHDTKSPKIILIKKIIFRAELRLI